jgi:hypothetical protein
MEKKAPSFSVTYTGHVDWVLLGSCNEPGSNVVIDLNSDSGQPSVLAGFECAAPLPENLSKSEVQDAPENHRFKVACGEMLCANGWCFCRPTDKSEADWPYYSVAITKRMLTPGAIFVGPTEAAPTYTVVPSELPTPGMTVSGVMDAIPSLLRKAGITDFDGALVTGFVDLQSGSFSAICKAPIFNEDLRDPRNDAEYKRTILHPAPCRCYFVGALISNHQDPCPNLHHSVYAGAAGTVGSAAAAAPPSGASTHVHCLQLAPGSPLCAGPLADCDPAQLGPAAGVEGVWHLNCLDSVVATDAAAGGAAVRLRVFAVKDSDIRPHVPQTRAP